ncbi:hypothetical protein [Joostella sp. CR20]|uniref:hypothetical protein n=1 Tax=Joostella sp. CR20 TaxID=2804312 RepID=UPI00313C2EFE
MLPTISYLDVYHHIHTKTTHSVGKIQLLLDNDDGSAPDALYVFLNEIEDIFRRNQISAFTTIATYRIELLNARTAIDQRIPQKKYQLDTTSALIPNITQTVSEVLKPIETKINTARNIIKTLIFTAYDSNIITSVPPKNFTEMATNLWALFINHDSFKEKAFKVAKALPQDDILMLICEEVYAMSVKISSSPVRF